MASGQLHLHLNLLLHGAGHHPAAWRLARAAHRPTSLAHYQALARTAERGRFDAITVVDAQGLADGADWPQSVQLEPLTLLGALAATTGRIGLVAQASTQHHQPYNIARRLASLDHTSRGRAGWLVQEASRAGEALNFDHDDAPQAAARSREFVDVLRRLWDSWQDDARIVDKAAGHYVDTRRIRAIDHVGDAFRVTGPIDIPRSPQGRPPVLREGRAASTGAFDDADVVLTHVRDLQDAQAQYERVKAKRPAGVRVLPVVSLLCSPSDTARARSQALLARHGAWPAGMPLLAGRPADVAETLLSWVDHGAADGFTLALPLTAEGLDDVVDYLVPELQRRGRYREDYAGRSLREHLGLARPAGRTTAAGDTASPAAA